MRVALVGPPQSGKSTLFAAAAEAGGSDVDPTAPTSRLARSMANSAARV